MFKTLITTCLLTFSCASGTLKEVPQTNDLNVRNAYGTYNLQGDWCFRDVFDVTWDSYEYEYTYYDYTSYGNGITAPKGLFITSNGSTQSYIDVRTLYVHDYGDGGFTFHCSFGEELISEDVYINDTLSNFPYQFKHLIMWFPSATYVSQRYYEIWTCLFQRSANNYCTAYTGWYTFVNFDENVKWQLCGSLIVNNNLQTYMTYNNGNCYVDNITYIDNGTLNGSSAFYLDNVLITDAFYDAMTDTGVFNFAVQPVTYSFGDMIFSVIDAPIYMLSQLFSFELFGIQFYVAFMGITTVLLIFFIVRKVI